MRYTKGPWKVEEEVTENGVTHVHIRAKPDRHPSIGPQICEVNYHLDFKNDLGNAHLIAAAPEMYEVLEFIKQRLEAWVDHHEIRIRSKHIEDTVSDVNCRDNYKVLINAADLALKKARGEI